MSLEEARRFAAAFNLSEKWIVSVVAVGGIVQVSPIKGLLGVHLGEFFVSKPNFVERLFGVTWQSKIAKAKDKCQKICDEMNREEAEAKAAANA